MSDILEDLNNIKASLGNAFESLKLANNNLAERLDHVEALITEITQCIAQQTITIGEFSKANMLLFEEISQLKGRILLLESVRDNPFKFSGNN